MTLHLKRLAVGTESVDHLADFQAQRLTEYRAAGDDRLFTFTRMVPKRATELTDGGSLYWIINGQIRVRQAILAIEEDRDETGRRFCGIQIDPQLVLVQPRAHRPFQGWRYLKPEDAPPDQGHSEGHDAEELPEGLADELRALGLLS